MDVNFVAIRSVLATRPTGVFVNFAVPIHEITVVSKTGFTVFIHYEF
jgi:hypothetical protein